MDAEARDGISVMMIENFGPWFEAGWLDPDHFLSVLGVAIATCLIKSLVAKSLVALNFYFPSKILG